MISQSAQSRSKDAGFTLIEVLVSLAILALISATLVQLIGGARRALNYVDRTNALLPVVAAQNYLHDALSQVQPVDLIVAGEQTSLAVQGDSEHIALTTSHASQGVYQGLYRVFVGPTSNRQGGVDLIVEQEIYRPKTEPTAISPRLKSTLIKNIVGVSFSYFASDVQDGESHWQNSWSSGIPRMVSIDVRFPKGDVRVWQPMTVSLAAAATFGLRCPPRAKCD